MCTTSATGRRSVGETTGTYQARPGASVSAMPNQIGRYGVGGGGFNVEGQPLCVLKTVGQGAQCLQRRDDLVVGLARVSRR